MLSLCAVSLSSFRTLLMGPQSPLAPLLLVSSIPSSIAQTQSSQLPALGTFVVHGRLELDLSFHIFTKYME